VGRPSNRAQRRAEIVDGLQTVMALQGYEAASVAEVAKAAGLTTGLVHYHFKSKQEILLALIDRLGQAVEDRAGPRVAKAATPRAKLDALLDVHLARGQGDPEALACWVAIGAEAIRQPAVREAYGAVLGRRVERFAALLREALVRAGSSTRGAKAGAAALSATIEGYFQLAAASPDLVPRGSAARSAKRMLDGLLAA
jgi:TetR/AcrR family transcriptional regulator, transcriptional repressor of bet genes